MSEYLHINHGNEQEEEALLELLNRSFGFETEKEQFLGLLPKLYKPGKGAGRNNVILDVDGEMRAAVGVYYNDLTVMGQKLTTAGIGNVCVSPDHRRKDYMKAVMSVAVDEIKQNNTDLSFLGGHRQRYNYFSYEIGGERYAFRMMKRNFWHKLGKCEMPDADVRELTEADAELLRQIAAANDANPCHFTRPADEMLDILRSWHSRAFAVSKDGALLGWFVYNDNLTYLSEVGYTEEAYIETILLAAMCTCANDGVNVCVPRYDVPLWNYLGVYGENFEITASEHFSILNYEPVIRAYLNLKASYEKLPDGECVIYFEGIKLPEQLRIRVKNNEVSVEEDFSVRPDLVLTHLEAVRLVSSPFSEKRSELAGACAAWFPLPIYVSGPDAV